MTKKLKPIVQDPTDIVADIPRATIATLWMIIEGVGDLLGFGFIRRAWSKYRCPRCNYPIFKTENKCPNCGQPFKRGKT